ncbi:MAG: DUF3194 domain-containing protein [Candidatus Bathyarchaeia archaeon]
MSKRPVSSLSYEELEKICKLAEGAARRYVMSKVPKEYVSDIYISVDLESSDSLNIDVEVELTLSPLCKNVNVDEIAKGSVKAAFDAVEKYLGDQF